MGNPLHRNLTNEVIDQRPAVQRWEPLQGLAEFARIVRSFLGIAAPAGELFERCRKEPNDTVSL